METLVDAFVWPLRLLGLGADDHNQHLPLLEIPHNALVNHLIPSLTNKEKGALALTCKLLWQLVAATITRLKFGNGPGDLCLAAKSSRLLLFTNVTAMHLTVRGWHDIGRAAPQLLLHLAQALPKVQEVILFNKSHEDVYEPLDTPGTGGVAQQLASSLWQAATGGAGADTVSYSTCNGCGYDLDLPDSSAVLVSLLALYPGLKRLEVYTKLFSVAEVSAISRLPQLTSLTLNSEDGVAPGALCTLSQLATLQELRLGDVDGNNPDDITTVCHMVTRLTSLHMGYCPRLQPPVLRRLQQVHAAVEQYMLEQKQHAEQERRMLEMQAAGFAGRAARAAHTATSVAGAAAASVLGLAGSSLMGVVPGAARDQRPAQQQPVSPTMRKSEQMLLDAGVPHNNLKNEPGSQASSAALEAAAAVIRAEDSLSYAQQQAQQQHCRTPNTTSQDSSAATTGAEGSSGGPNQGLSVDAAVTSDAATGAPVTAASRALPGAVSQSPGPGFRLVTELSVNIDAEEGEEILYEMSQLGMLESLLVDSTDEFSFDPGFQPFGHTTNLRKLAITMPMSLANTQSLSRCRQLRELLLCALPKETLEAGSFDQVTRLELLDVAANPPNPHLLQAFSRVSHMIIQSGADDTTLGLIGQHLTNLVHLELYNLPAGYSQGGLRGIAGVRSLKSLVLEVASPGRTIAARTRNMASTHNPLMLPFGLVSEVAHEITAAASSMGMPLGTNPILAFAPPADWGLPSFTPKLRRSTWFPSLHVLSILGYVVAADRDLHALSHLPVLHTLNMHLQGSRGLAGSITLRGLWGLVEQSPNLSIINLTGCMDTQLLVPGRVPGVGM